MIKVSKVKAQKDLKSSIKKAVDLIGGFESFVKKGEVVLLKPNFNTADPPPASTDLEFLKAVIQLVLEQGAKSIIVGESSTYYLNTQKVMAKKGVFALENLGWPVRVIAFEEAKWVKKLFWEQPI